METLQLAPPMNCDVSKYGDYDLSGRYKLFPLKASTFTRPTVRSWKAKNAYVIELPTPVSHWHRC